MQKNLLSATPRDRRGALVSWRNKRAAVVLALGVLAALAPAAGACPLEEAPSPRFSAPSQVVRVEVAQKDPRVVALPPPVVRAPRFGAAIYAVPPRPPAPVQVIELRVVVP